MSRSTPRPTPSSVPTWDEVVEQHSDRVFRLAYRLTGNRPDAEDLTQEVFVRVFRSLDTYTPGTFEGWLHRITTNLFLDGARRKQRIRFDPLSDERAARLTSAVARARARRTPTRPSTTTSRRALATLPPDFRAAVVLCDVEGLSYEEIAEIMDAKLGTVRSRIHRGRAHAPQGARPPRAGRGPRALRRPRAGRAPAGRCRDEPPRITRQRTRSTAASRRRRRSAAGATSTPATPAATSSSSEGWVKTQLAQLSFGAVASRPDDFKSARWSAAAPMRPGAGHGWPPAAVPDARPPPAPRPGGHRRRRGERLRRRRARARRGRRPARSSRARRSPT